MVFLRTLSYAVILNSKTEHWNDLKSRHLCFALLSKKSKWLMVVNPSQKMQPRHKSGQSAIHLEVKTLEIKVLARKQYMLLNLLIIAKRPAAKVTKIVFRKFSWRILTLKQSLTFHAIFLHEGMPFSPYYSAKSYFLPFFIVHKTFKVFWYLCYACITAHF